MNIHFLGTQSDLDTTRTYIHINNVAAKIAQHTPLATVFVGVQFRYWKLSLVFPPAKAQHVVFGTPAESEHVVLGSPTEPEHMVLRSPTEPEHMVLRGSAESQHVVLGGSAEPEHVIICGPLTEPQHVI